MPADVLDVTKKFMRDPIRILVKKEELTLEGIRQFYIEVEQEVGIVTQIWSQVFCFKTGAIIWDMGDMKCDCFALITFPQV